MGVENLQKLLIGTERQNKISEKGEYCVPLPYSTQLESWIFEDETIFLEAISSFQYLNRLNNIKSLSWLVDSNPNSSCGEEYFNVFPQTRFYHSLLVSKVMGEILKNNQFPERDIQIGIVSGLLHDIATPALGDATKNIDPDNLHEKNNWRQCITEKGWQYFNKYNIDTNLIDQTIKKNGTLGRLLDFSDKLSYTMIDLYNLVGDFSVKVCENGIGSEYKNILISIIKKDKNIGDLFNELQFNSRTGQFFFTDPERLGRLLMVKALLYKNLYLNPISQGRDLKIASLITPHYSHENKNENLTSSILIKMTDYDLLDYLSKKENMNFLEFENYITQYYPKFYFFSNIEIAEPFVKKIQEDESIKFIGIKECKGFNTHTSFLVQNKAYKLIPFSEYNPKISQQLELISESSKGFFVFYEENN